MEWVKLGIDIAAILGHMIVGALQRGDDAVLDRSINDILGTELKSVIAKRVADARAAEKFGS